MTKKTKAVALFSGGLDSILAIKLIMNQGIDVVGVNFRTPFFGLDQKYINPDFEIDLKIVDISLEYMNILKNPLHGYGKNINPCIDCHAFMFKSAGDFMNRINASFIISGEVLGERPMSQNRGSLSLIEKMSGYSGLILRPLSALLLPETIPEKNGIVDRNKLLNISGRSRKRQIALAERMGIIKYPSPAGGCKLTEPGFAHRLKDLLSHEKYDMKDIELLKIGRHFRLDGDTKIVIGRNMGENSLIETFFKVGDILFKPKKTKGPTALLKTNADLNEELILKACRIVSRYCDKEGYNEIEINYYHTLKHETPLVKKILPLEDEELNLLRV